MKHIKDFKGILPADGYAKRLVRCCVSTSYGEGVMTAYDARMDVEPKPTWRGAHQGATNHMSKYEIKEAKGSMIQTEN